MFGIVDRQTKEARIRCVLTNRTKPKLLAIGKKYIYSNVNVEDSVLNDEELSKKLGLEKNILFTGKAPWSDIPYYYHVANLFVTASKTETQGLTVLEAMAAGLPVVALDDDAFREVVSDDYNGFLFKDKNVIFKI